MSARVAEIQSNSDPSQWRHVPGELNVADDVSRGIPAQRLIGRWKQGPEFLRLPEEEWPQESSTADLNEVEKERRKTQAILLTSSPEVIDYKKFSNWRKLVRTSAYVFRFISNLRTRYQAKKLPETPEHQIQLSCGPLAPQELEKAEKYWVKKSQPFPFLCSVVFIAFITCCWRYCCWFLLIHVFQVWAFIRLKDSCRVGAMVICITNVCFPHIFGSNFIGTPQFNSLNSSIIS